MSSDDRVELSIPEGGIVFDEFVLGLPTAADLDRLSATYAEPDAFTRAELAELVPHMNALLAVGRLVPLLVKDARTGEILGGGTFRNFDADEAAVEIGYWLYPHARGRGVATRTARALAEHAFGLGVRRVVARVKVGNAPPSASSNGRGSPATASVAPSPRLMAASPSQSGPCGRQQRMSC